MNLDFFTSIAIIALIFFILSSGFKFFLNLKQELDFSYIAIIIFGSYASVIINNTWQTGILASAGLAFLLAIIFTFFILYLSSKLSEVYFIIGTLSLYMISLHLARNLEITGGAMGISTIGKEVISGISVYNSLDFLVFISLLTGIIIIILWYIKKTYFYTGLIAWGENEVVVTALGVSIRKYTLFMIMLTTFLAVIGGTLYAFNFMYIDPNTFWTSMVLPILIISLMSYKFKEIGTLIISFGIIFFYEYIRFIKIVEPQQLGFFREIIFSLLVMIAAYLIFRKTHFGREV